MTAFQSGYEEVARVQGSGGLNSRGSDTSGEAKSAFAKAMLKQEESDNAKEIAKVVAGAIESEDNYQRGEQASAKNAFVSGNKAQLFGDSGFGETERAEMASYYKMEEKASKASVTASSKEEAQVRSMASYESAAYREQEARVNTAAKATGDAQASVRKMAGYESQAYKEQEDRENNVLGEAHAENKAFDKAAENADKDQAKASKEASDNLREFGNAVKQAGSVLGTLYEQLKKGVASSMSTSQVATETGMDFNAVRDLEYGIAQNTDLSQPEALGLISKTGDIRSQLSTESGQADYINKVMPQLAQMGVQLDYNELTDLNTPELLDMFVSRAPSDPKEHRKYYETLGISDAIHLRGRTTSKLAIDAQDRDLGKLREGKTTQEKVSQTAQDLREKGVEETPETLVQILGYGAMATSAIGVGGAAYGAAKGMSKAGSLMQTAKSTGGTAAKLGKGAMSLAKANPIGLATTAATLAARSLGGVEDDGGMADSALDVAEFALTGAALGSFVPVVGTAVGGAVGAAVGAANEAWEYFTADDAVPSANLGNMPMQGKDATKSSNNIVNVEVTNEISPDLIKTTTNVDGDLSVDEESNIGTGG